MKIGIEFKYVFFLAVIFAIRMLGLFMILPIFALAAPQLLGNTPLLVGITLGIYGLTQAIMQIPFGLLSDRYGRKLLISIGLLILILGSLIAAYSSTIYGVMIGRALQGLGAIGSSLLAFSADVTREEQRSIAMALIGMTIGVAFAIAMVLGPLLYTYIGLRGLFYLTAGLGGIALLILHTCLPTPTSYHHGRNTRTVPHLLFASFTHSGLWRLNLSIFLLHLILTLMFTALPSILTNQLSITLDRQWTIYLPVLLLSFLMILPLIHWAEQRQQSKHLLLLGIALLAFAQWLLWHSPQQLFGLYAMLLVFFVGFNLLEASLPALVSKSAPAGSRGTAMGVYSSCQFLGIFSGGSLAGSITSLYTLSSVFLLGFLLCLVWLGLMTMMKNPSQLTTKVINLATIGAQQHTNLLDGLLTIPGVADAIIIEEESSAYLKIDKHIFDEQLLQKVMEKNKVRENKGVNDGKRNK